MMNKWVTGTVLLLGGLQLLFKAFGNDVLGYLGAVGTFVGGVIGLLFVVYGIMAYMNSKNGLLG